MTFAALTIGIGLLPVGLFAADNAVNVSWGDHIIVYNGAAKLDTPEKIAAAMEDYKRLVDAKVIYWRVSSWYMRNYMEHREASFPRYFQEVERIWSSFDPLACAIEQAHRRGLRIYAYQTIYDEGSPTDVLYGDSTPFPWQSRFTIEHPELLVVDREGQKRQWGVLEYAYPQARRYMLGVLTRLVDVYDFDGLYVCTRTHSKPADHADQFGFNEPVIRAYKEAYGADPRTEEFDRVKWRDLRGGFLTQLLRELRQEMRKRDKRVAVAIPRGNIIGPPYGNMTLQWREWVKEGLVDELVIGAISGSWHYPSMRGKDKERGYLASQDEGWGLPSLEDDIRENYAPLCTRYGVSLKIGGSYWERRDRERLQDLGLNGYVYSSGSLASRPGYVIVPHHELLDFSDARFTVECWLKYPEEITQSRVLSKYDHTIGDNGRGWEIYVDEEGHVVWRLNDGRTDHAITSQGKVPVGRWFHLVCVSEGAGGRMRIYLDGKPDPTSAPAPEAIRSVPVDLYIGRYPGGGNFLRAMIDEVHLSKMARTFDGVPAGRPTPDERTVALWSFEDESWEVQSLTHGDVLVGRIIQVSPIGRVDGPAGCGHALSLAAHE